MHMWHNGTFSDHYHVAPNFLRSNHESLIGILLVTIQDVNLFTKIIQIHKKIYHIMAFTILQDKASNFPTCIHANLYQHQ